MGIGKGTGRPSRPAGEWSVSVAVSLMECVPRDILAAWMAIESYAGPAGECWPGNAALARRMGVKSIPSAQRALAKLEDYGIVRRHDLGGHRRKLLLLKRTSEPITRAQWAVLAEPGEARQAEPAKPIGRVTSSRR